MRPVSPGHSRSIANYKLLSTQSSGPGRSAADYLSYGRPLRRFCATEVEASGRTSWIGHTRAQSNETRGSTSRAHLRHWLDLPPWKRCEFRASPTFASSYADHGFRPALASDVLNGLGPAFKGAACCDRSTGPAKVLTTTTIITDW